MNVYGNVKAILKYVLRKGQSYIELINGEDGTTSKTVTWKFPATPDTAEREVVEKDLAQTITNKSINADPSAIDELGNPIGNIIEDIKDASIKSDANIQGSKLLDESVGNAKIAPRSISFTASDTGEVTGPTQWSTTELLMSISTNTGEVIISPNIVGSKVTMIASNGLVYEYTVDSITPELGAAQSWQCSDITVNGTPSNFSGFVGVNDANTDLYLSEGGIDGQKLWNESVDTTKLSNNSVTTDKLADDSITFSKLEDDLYVGEQGVDITANVVSVKLVDEDATNILIINENPLYNGTYIFLGSGYDTVGGTLTIDSDSSYGAYGRTDGTGLILFATGNSAYMFWQTSSDPALLNWDTSESGPYDPSIGLSGLEYLTPNLVTENGKYAPNIGTYEVSAYSYLETSADGLTASVVDSYADAEAGKLMDAQDIKDEVDSLRNYAETSSIDGGRLVDGTVTDDKIADLDGSKLVNRSISGIKLEDGSIDDSKISSLDGSKLVNLSVTREKIADGAIDADKLDAALIFDGVIADDSIEDRHIKEYVPTTPEIPAVNPNAVPLQADVNDGTYSGDPTNVAFNATIVSGRDIYLDVGPASPGPYSKLEIDLPNGTPVIIRVKDGNGVIWEFETDEPNFEATTLLTNVWCYVGESSTIIKKDGVQVTAQDFLNDFQLNVASFPVSDDIFNYGPSIPAIPEVPASGGISGDKLWDSSIANSKIAGYSGEIFASAPTTSTKVSAEFDSDKLVIGGRYDLSDSDSYRLTDSNNDVWDIFDADVISDNGGGLSYDLESDAPENSGYYGQKVAISDSYTVVSAPNERGGDFNDGGIVYVYSNFDGSLLYILESDNPEGFGRFGSALDVSESYIVVGASNEDAQNFNTSGRAYVYSTSDGSLLYTLESDNIQSIGQFGESVAVSDSYIVVGAGGERAQNLQSSGRAYVYSTSDGSLLYTLESDNIQEYGRFGWDVSVSESFLVVSAKAETAQGVSNSGRVYVYSISDGSLLYAVESDNPKQFGEFGFAVDVNESYVIVGAQYEDAQNFNTSGRVYVYSVSNGSLLYTLESPNIENGSQFGRSVSISESYIIAGATYEDVQEQSAAGRAYVYSAFDGSLLYTFESSNVTWAGQFGESVGITESYAVVGAFNEPAQGLNNSGKAYVYSTLASSTIENAEVVLKNNSPSSLSDFSAVVDVDPAILDLKKGYNGAVDGSKIKVGSIPSDRLESVNGDKIEDNTLSYEKLGFLKEVIQVPPSAINGDSNGVTITVTKSPAGEVFLHFGDLVFTDEVYGTQTITNQLPDWAIPSEDVYHYSMTTFSYGGDDPCTITIKTNNVIEIDAQVAAMDKLNRGSLFYIIDYNIN